VQYATHARTARLDDHRPRVIFGVTGVHDHGTIELVSERELRRERAALQVTRRVIVVVVETAFADGNRTVADEALDRLDVAQGIEVGAVVRVDAGGEKNEAGMSIGDVRGAFRGGNRFTNRNDGQSAGDSSAFDGLVAIRVEGGIGEMRVAVDEGRHQ
jgi:hypothetical protein